MSQSFDHDWYSIQGHGGHHKTMPNKWVSTIRPLMLRDCDFKKIWIRWSCLRELKTIYHHHYPESKKRNSSEGNSGCIHPYGRYGNAGRKTRKTISSKAIPWPVRGIFDKRAATVEVDTFIFPVSFSLPKLFRRTAACRLLGPPPLWSSLSRWSTFPLVFYSGG